MAPASLPPASSVLATLSLPSNRLAAARLASERGGAPVADQPEIDHYRILRTDEVDARDAPLTAEERASIIATAAAAIRSTGDDFAGTARMAAKLSIADAPAESFETVAAVIATLPAKSDMVNHDPRIRDDRESERVVEEKRNVRLSAFLYAASRENDNDFHLIVGQNPQGQEEVHDDGSVGPSAGERRHLRQAEVRTRLVPRLLRRQDAGGDLRLLRSANSDTGGGVAVLRYEPCAWAKPRPADAASTYAGDLGGPPDFQH